jgi:hypothetical protein
MSFQRSPSRGRKFWLWTCAAILAAGALWFARLAAYNYWAAGGPPVSDPLAFQARGNAFGVVTVILLIGALIASVGAIRARAK